MRNFFAIAFLLSVVLTLLSLSPYPVHGHHEFARKLKPNGRKFSVKEKGAMFAYLSNPFFNGGYFPASDKGKGELFFSIPHADTVLTKNRESKIWFLLDYVLADSIKQVPVVYLHDYFAFDSTIFNSVAIHTENARKDRKLREVFKLLERNEEDRMELLLANLPIKYTLQETDRPKGSTSDSTLYFTIDKRTKWSYNFIAFIGDKNLRELYYDNMTRVIYDYVFKRKLTKYTHIAYIMPEFVKGIDREIRYNFRSRAFPEFFERAVFNR